MYFLRITMLYAEPLNEIKSFKTFNFIVLLLFPIKCNLYQFQLSFDIHILFETIFYVYDWLYCPRLLLDLQMNMYQIFKDQAVYHYYPVNQLNY
jgi:hypothetical protein